MAEGEFERPYPKTEEELLAYIRESLDFEQPTSEQVIEAMGDEEKQQEMSEMYVRSADTMWKCALAAFNYAAHQVGATGWQASVAELMFLRHSRGMKGPLALLDANDMVYPQYDLRERVEKYLEEWGPWAAEEARKKLAEWEAKADGVEPAPRVREHWEALSRRYPAEEKTDG